jgi:TolB-like protein
MAGLFEELKRRNVFKVGTAYVVLSWLLAQAADLASDTFAAPDWVMKMLVTMLALLFPLVLFFAWAYELTPEGIKKEKDVDRSRSITHHTGRKLDFTIIGILIIALGYFVWESRFESREAVIPADTSSRTPIRDGIQQEAGEASDDSSNIASDNAVVLDPKSIAVLPFINMSSDPEQEYFSDGITEEILNALARVEDLKVAGRTSSFAFKGQNEDLKEIGEALRVANILEGSVRKSGNRLRITAQLVKVDDGFHLWSETYDREMDDIFAIQDEISNAILVQMKAKLLGGEKVASKEVDPQAYAQYLLAKQRIYERSQASLELAAELLSKAIDTDPGFAAAQAQLGIAILLLSEEQYGTLPHYEAQEKGLKYLDAALALEPEQAEALAGMGLYEGGFPGGDMKAIAWLRRSLQSDPHQSNASNWLANNLRAVGQTEESLELREKDFARDPLYMPVFSSLVQMYTVRGEMDKARQVLDQLRPYLHDDANMTMTEGGYFQVTGQWAKADQAFATAYAKEPRNFVNQIWYCNNLNFTAQYQRCAELGSDTQAAIALTHLGRSEEGLIRGHAAVVKGQYPGFFFQAMIENGQYQQLVQFVEERWPELSDLDRDFPDLQGWGSFLLVYVAEAYKNLGNEAKFQQAMKLAKASNDLQVSQGADNWSISYSRAYIAMLGDDQDEAITLLERAFDQGLVVDLTAPKAWPVFQPLRGDPRFEAARSKMLEHLNAERVEMGLEPLST